MFWQQQGSAGPSMCSLATEVVRRAEARRIRLAITPPLPQRQTTHPPMTINGEYSTFVKNYHGQQMGPRSVCMRSDIKSDRPRCKKMIARLVNIGWRRIEINGEYILEVRSRANGRWYVTSGMDNSIQNNDSVWSYVGKGGKICTFFKDGHYTEGHRIVPRIQI